MITYAGVQEGQALPSAQRTPTTQRVGRYLGERTSESTPFMNADAAQRMGLPTLIVPGPLKLAYLEHYLRRWLDGGGALRRLRLSHRRPDFHGETMTFGGTVSRKYEDHGEKALDLEIWIDNAKGERSVRAAATVVLR